MRVSEKNKSWYVADFETTGMNEYEATGRTRVWLYSICDSDSNIVEDGDCIEKFMEWCKGHHSSLIYFHNLKFDGSFIICWLLEHGFPYEEKLTSHSKRGFSTLIGDMGEFYQMKINFAPNCQVVLYDSLKLIPLTVANIAKAFGLPIQKEIIDYNDYTITPEKLSYVHNDVRIVAMALKFFRDSGHTRMTIGSNAYHSFMDTYGSNALFPRLPKEWIEEWRPAYRGGRSQVNPKYAGELLKNVRRYDINSMYPSIMAYMALPYGAPIEKDKPSGYRFELYEVMIAFKLKEGHMPTLLKSGTLFSKAGDTYYTETILPINIKISNIDLELMYKHYDITYIRYIKVQCFKTYRYYFQPWVEEHYKQKSEAIGGLRLVYKLILNSLYGKFGSRPTGQNKIPVLDENGVLQYTLSDDHDMGLYYLPVAIAIVSWAHKLIDDAICATGIENFVYCDTDSVHTLGTLPADMVDNKELGKFKLEGIEERAKYVRQKTYIYYQEGQWEMTCAGMPQSVKNYLLRRYGDNIIDEFKVGLHVDIASEGISERDMKLRPIHVPGGTILTPVPFTLL